MVFEAVVVEVLNRFLKEYVENLDASQLKIGIWGGDVVLNDLLIRDTALNDLKLPVKISWGQLGKLVLKIPWKNLYSSPVIACIEDLFLLVIPESEIKYEEEKEERWKQELKQAELRRIEEVKKREAEKDAPPVDDTFTEKLVSQIVRNLQVKINNIHLRYEDKTTHPGKPFCFGATIATLSVETAESATNDQKNSIFIFKSLTLEGLSIYWNPSSDLLSGIKMDEMKTYLREQIPRGTKLPSDYSYLFGPISSSANLILNPKPEADGSNFTNPKIKIDIAMEEFSIAITRRQFEDIMLLIDNLANMSKAFPFRKYRPSVSSYCKYYKHWWKYAYNCVLVDITRRRNDWNWKHILGHRQMCREYMSCYQKKLLPKPPPPDVEKKLADLEKILDVFNIVLLRQRAAVEVERVQVLQKEENVNRGWFGGWFSRKPATESEQFTSEIAKKIEQALTSEEKQNLYRAIDYQENSTPTYYPPSFVQFRLNFTLKSTKVQVRDDLDNNMPLVMNASLQDFLIAIEQRPSASAFKAVASCGDFSIFGIEQPTGVPQLVKSRCNKMEKLLDIVYETNPLDGLCDQRLHITARPLNITYNAETLNRLQSIFSNYESQNIERFKERTAASLPTFRQMSSVGLQFAIERRARLDIKIHVSASAIIIPEKGTYIPDVPMLVIRLGTLRVETEQQKTSNEVSVRQMFLRGNTEDEIFNTIVSESYTKFYCQLIGVQILMSFKGEDWASALKASDVTPLHLLQPTNLELTIKKSLITDDARIPKIIIEGNLPGIYFHFMEERLLAVAALFYSIPHNDEGINFKQSITSSMWSIASAIEAKFTETIDVPLTDSPEIPETVQGINVVCNFSMKEFVVNVYRVTPEKSQLNFVKLALNLLELKVKQKTFENKAKVCLSGISVTQWHKGERIAVVTAEGTDQSEHLFVADVVNCDQKSPDFYTSKGAVIFRVDVKMAQLMVVLNQDALLDQIAFANALSEKLNEVKVQCNPLEIEEDWESARVSRYISRDKYVRPHRNLKKRQASGRNRKTPREKRVAVIDILANIFFNEIKLRIVGKSPLSEIAVHGIELSMSSRKSYSKFNIKLTDMLISDLNEETAFRKIMTTTQGSETISIKIVIFNEDFRMPDDTQMSVTVEMAQIRFVYLFRFLSEIIEFSNSFQGAKKAIAEASSAAAEKARQNVMKAYEDAARIELHVNIKAPLIFVPLCSTSYDALVFDLGVMEVDNIFSNLEVENEYPAAIDSIHLRLSNLTLLRATVDPDTVSTILNYSLIPPVSLNVFLKRNLSASWFKKIPDLELDLRLDHFEIGIDEQDYLFCLSVLNENHAEGFKKQESVALANLDAQKSKMTIQEDREATIHINDEVTEVHTTLLFTFSLEKFTISLYPGGSANITSKDHLKKRHKHGLAQFLVETLAVKGKIMSDGALSTSVRLVNCIIKDIRPFEGERVTTLLERKTVRDSDELENKETYNSMFDITYQKTLNEQFIDVRVYSFIFVISVDYFMKIAQFFTVEKPKIEPPIQTQKSPRRGKDGNTGRHGASLRPIAANKEQQFNSLTLNIRLEKPDIVIVENKDSAQSDALIFHTEVFLRYRQTNGKQLISGSLNNFQLHSCSFSPKINNENKIQVIKPMSVSIEGSTPENCGPHVEIRCTPVHISVTPKTITLLNACYQTLMKVEGTSEKDEEEKDLNNLWTPREFKETDYWFLTPEVALEALEYSLEDTPENFAKKHLDELCIISVPSIVITIESGMGNSTVPMLLLEFGIEGQAKNWSSKLKMECAISLGMNYYNSCLASWEPVLEPIEVKKNGRIAFIPWEMTCEVTKSMEEDIGPKLAVNISSKDTLEVTVTKTCLEVINQLAESFSNAMLPSAAINASEQKSPHYLIKNESGMSIEVLLNSSKLQLDQSLKNACVIIENNAEFILARSSAQSDSTSLRALTDFEISESYLVVNFSNLKKESIQVPLGRRAKRCYAIPNGLKKEKWIVVVDISSEQNTTSITFRSIVQVINHFYTPIQIHMAKHENEIELVGTVEPNSAFNIPPHAVYTRTGELFFSVEGYSISVTPFSWLSLQNEVSKIVQMQCKPEDKDNVNPFFLKVFGELECAYFQNTQLHNLTSRCYTIHLQPTIEFCNTLPTEVIVCSEGSVVELVVQPGQKVQLSQADPGVSYMTTRLPNYLDKEWICWTDFTNCSEGLDIWEFDSYDGADPVSMHLGVHFAIVRGTISVTLYCPFWMINKTGLYLSYTFDAGGQVIYHPASYSEPIMFSPGHKRLMGKKKGMIRVEQGAWSDKFPLDVAGSGGLVHCRTKKGETLTLSVTIRLSQNGLTKIIVITPGYMLVNKTNLVIEVREDTKFPITEWKTLQPDGCSSLWPSVMFSKNTRLLLRVAGTEECSCPFHFHSTHSCLLALDNKFGGILVDVQNTQSGVYISFYPYEPGLAPVLIFNYTSTHFIFWEKGNEYLRKIELNPNTLCLYAWENPAGSQQIGWYDENSEEVLVSLKEDFLEETILSRGKHVWVSSFLDGTQRILLFTQDRHIALGTQGSFNLDSADLDVKLDLQAVGISVVNNVAKKELIYIGLVSSGIVWEEKKPKSRGRYKSLDIKDSALIEKAYNKYKEDCKSGRENPVVVLDNRLKVSFENMEILEPQRRDLRRMFSPGLHASYETYEHSIIMHCLINRLQIDNQMYNCIFPVILAPVPPPRTVAANNKPKPFLELSIFKRVTAHSTVQQYKYFKILIQEFHVKLDIGFVDAITEFLAVAEPSHSLFQSRFAKDLKLSKEPLHAHISFISSQEQKNFYDLLHFSPLKIHFSFSLAGNVDSKILPSALSGLLQSLEVSLTDINDAVFRLSYFERKNSFITVTQLKSEAMSHYIGQALRQAYVIIFGLDVIGNPFGLVVGISEGVEALFYEPFQGIIQGPGDFAEGLSLGMRSLFGRTVGGAAGAFGRITGTIGKGLAALSLDKEYQQKRIEQQKQRRSENLQVQMAQGGKGLVMGVVEGVTGIVTKPISGAKQEGVGGFFKGMGKGVVGLVTRPVSGVVDFASTSLNAVKRATDLTEEINSRLRPPRFFREDIVTPYRLNEAYGSKILYQLGNGRYISTDLYESHAKISDKEILILSNKRVILAHLSDIFGVWQESFTVSWSDLIQEPEINPKGIVLHISKRKAGVFTHTKETKVLPIQSFEKENLLKIMKELFIAERKTAHVR